MRLIGLILLLIPLGGVSQSHHMDIVAYQPGSYGLVYPCDGFLWMNDSLKTVVIDIDSTYYNKFLVTDTFVGKEDDTVFVMQSVLEEPTVYYEIIFRNEPKARAYLRYKDDSENPIILLRSKGDREPY